ncbi:MAG: hypothetical protein ACP5U2_14225 [Bryobacteraceae bacterium]
MTDIFQRMLCRVANAPLAPPAPHTDPLPARLMSATQRFLNWLARPGSVLDLMLFVDGQLVRRETYDSVAGRLVRYPERQQQAVAGVLDFMRDSLGGQDNSVAYTAGDVQVAGLIEGRYTLVAITRAGVRAETIQMWLQRLLLQMPRQA